MKNFFSQKIKIGNKIINPKSSPFVVAEVSSNHGNSLKNIKNIIDQAKKNFLPIQKGDVKETLSDSSLLYEITKYKPKINYVEGITRFIKWYKDYYQK